MRKVFVIAAKEFRTFFSGPAGYVAASLFIFIMSWMFFQILSAFAQRSLMNMGRGGGMSLNEFVFQGHFNNANVILLFLIPAMTMRLFAEEKKNRTMDLLMTSPLTATQIVLGKLFGGLFIVWTIVSLMAVYPLSTLIFSTIDKGPILTSFLGMYLISGVYVAIGIFASSLTDNAIIAYVLAFIIELFFFVIGWASVSMEGASSQAIFNYLAIISHFGNFSKGMIDTSSVVYYVTLIGFFGFLTQRVIESARWR